MVRVTTVPLDALRDDFMVSTNDYGGVVVSWGSYQVAVPDDLDNNRCTDTIWAAADDLRTAWERAQRLEALLDTLTSEYEQALCDARIGQIDLDAAGSDIRFPLPDRTKLDVIEDAYQSLVDGIRNQCRFIVEAHRMGRDMQKVVDDAVATDAGFEEIRQHWMDLMEGEEFFKDLVEQLRTQHGHAVREAGRWKRVAQEAEDAHVDKENEALQYFELAAQHDAEVTRQDKVIGELRKLVALYESEYEQWRIMYEGVSDDTGEMQFLQTLLEWLETNMMIVRGESGGDGRRSNARLSAIGARELFVLSFEDATTNTDEPEA